MAKLLNQHSLWQSDSRQTGCLPIPARPLEMEDWFTDAKRFFIFSKRVLAWQNWVSFSGFLWPLGIHIAQSIRLVPTVTRWSSLPRCHVQTYFFFLFVGNKFTALNPIRNKHLWSSSMSLEIDWIDNVCFKVVVSGSCWMQNNLIIAAPALNQRQSLRLIIDVWNKPSNAVASQNLEKVAEYLGIY